MVNGDLGRYSKISEGKGLRAGRRGDGRKEKRRVSRNSTTQRRGRGRHLYSKRLSLFGGKKGGRADDEGGNFLTFLLLHGKEKKR